MSDIKLGLEAEGPRGPRGHDGPTGPTGPTGSTGPTGPTGSATILHVEAKGTLTTLAPNAQTIVLTCPAITAPIGTVLEFTGVVQYINTSNTAAFGQGIVRLLQDGATVIDLIATPGAIPAAGNFDLAAILSVAWFLPGDGISHVYSLAVQTDATSDGIQEAGNSALFINVIG